MCAHCVKRTEEQKGARESAAARVQDDKGGSTLMAWHMPIIKNEEAKNYLACFNEIERFNGLEVFKISGPTILERTDERAWHARSL